ncbi:Bug family tripartite tricarboxylate transporter substrate binding protein [Cupriavidus pinatubonensis]|uniref:Bug family tripartite tricarboxylate transporter substrate binding protein n=1 Tax=Cupriavidus pinatubonensis TaxID=248026 RepID=UPI00112B3EAA|nr:tripartite tricarboxylate transporter substrate binding protein [Cupriavidus pinatubonensis]TPQ36350.1 tripartite tricarboxylate transporter substrate binding protein [Cupriavidus pinatubonensis]
MDRRQLLAWAAGTAVAMTLPGIVQAQTFPSKPVRLVVPQAGGTGNDVLARALAEKLAQAWKQPVVVENKPGANGTLAIGYVLGQPADGHTLFFAGVSNLAFNPFLYPKLPYNPTRDLTGVAMLASSPFVFVAAPSLNVSTFQDFVRMAKARPGEISFASGGIGNSTHLAMELVAERTGIRMQHVPFNGTGGSTSLMSGQTPVMMNVIAGVQPFFASKKLVPLAVTGDKRLPALPTVPTFKELGYDVQVPGWYAIVARAGTPASVVQKVNADINQVLDDPGFREKLGYQFLDPIKGPPTEVERYMKRDAAAWGPIIRRLNISL